MKINSMQGIAYTSIVMGIFSTLLLNAMIHGWNSVPDEYGILVSMGLSSVFFWVFFMTIKIIVENHE